MSVATGHTRSLRRRLIAFLLDLTLAGLLASLLLLPFAAGSDSRIRLSGGLLNVTTCEPGQASVFDETGAPISSEGWTTVSVCTVTSNFLFQDRKAFFLRQWTEGSVTYTHKVYFPVDSANRMVTPFYMDWLSSILLVFAAAAFESSAWRATPGKKLLGLAVVTLEGNTASYTKTLLRNAVKNGPLLAMSLFGVVATLVPWLLPPPAFIESGKVVFNAQSMSGMGSTYFVFAGLFTLAAIVLVATLLFPWKKAGRALYDRWAGTMVIRTPNG